MHAAPSPQAEVADQIPTSTVQEQVTRILASSVFAHSARMRSFLQYIVDETLAGRGRALKEYGIALSVYGKPCSFDPRIDSLVRVEASRLRSKLQKYYQGEGCRDPVLIRIPTGGFIPQFTARESATGTWCAETAPREFKFLELKAQHFFSRRDPASLRIALDAYTALSGTQSGLSAGMAGLAECHVAFAWLEFDAPQSVWEKTAACTRRARQRSPLLPQVLTVSACEQALHCWNWSGAEEMFQSAIQQNPRWTNSYQWFALFSLAPQGRFDEALFWLNKAREIEPASAVTACYIGRILYLKRQYSEALRELSHSLHLNPRLFPAYCDLGLVYARLERWQQATAALTAARRIAEEPLAVSECGYVGGMSGSPELTAETRSTLMNWSTSRYVSPMAFALLELAAGNIDGAFTHLYRALEVRAARVIHVAVDPVFDAIKTDPRFLDILSRINL